MEEINERLHVPDSDNIDVVVNNIMDVLFKEVLMEIYKNLPSSGKMIKDPIVDGFYIDSEINPCCPWLANDCGFVYHIHFKDKVTGSSLNDAGNGACYVERGNPNVIHNCVIDQTFNININDLIKYEGKYVPEGYLKLKANIRHELEHAYKESVHPEIFRYKEQPDGDKTEFMRAYDNISKRLVDLYDKSHYRRLTSYENDEFFLLELMYQCCYIERDAFVSGFYQRILDDAKNGELKSINTYYEYNKFKDGIERIKKFNNSSVLSDHKDDIKAMYGSAAAGNFDILRKHILSESDKILNKLQKVYGEVSKYGKIRKTDESIAKAESLYYKDLFKMFYGDKLNESEEYDTDMINNIISRLYIDSPYNMIVRNIKMFFGKMLY